MRVAETLTSEDLEVVAGLLETLGIEHGPLVSGRPWMNLNCHDGRNVFVKVSRPGVVDLDDSAHEPASALRASTSGVAACVPLYPEQVRIDLGPGDRRRVTIWAYEQPLDPPPGSARLDALVAAAASLAAVPAPVWMPAVDAVGLPGRVRQRISRVADPDLAALILGRASAEAGRRCQDHGPHVWLHGDLHPSNLLWTGTGPILGDFEMSCTGPLEWDLGQAARFWVMNPDGPETIGAAAADVCERLTRTSPARVDVDVVAAAALLRGASGLVYHLQSTPDTSATARLIAALRTG